MKSAISIQTQHDIINEVESKYLRFLEPNFDTSCFLKCRNNFILNSHIESQKIFGASNTINNPIFSIAIPTYNRVESLKESVYSALNQDTNIEYEVIVVENVDNFNLVSPAEEMLQKEFSKERITYYKNKENLGMFGNWNRCLELSKGKWVCILHSDDKIRSNYIEEMGKLIRERGINEYSLIGCLEQKANPYIINGGLREKFAYFLKKIKNTTTRTNLAEILDECNLQGPVIQLPPSAILHNKEKCFDLGGYNQDEYPLGDTSFHTRAYNHSKVAIYLKPLQYKTSSISEGLMPKTIMYYCYISPIFFYSMHQSLKPKFYAKMLRYKRIKDLHKKLIDYPILYNHVNILIKKYKFALPLSSISKVFSFYYLLKDFLNLKYKEK